MYYNSIINTFSINVKSLIPHVFIFLKCILYNIDMEKDIYNNDFYYNSSKNFDKTFVAERFARIRMAKNISARALSEKLGQSSQYINQIENGRKMPSLEGLYNFCEYFNISLSDFFNNAYEYPIQYRELFSSLNELDTEELKEITAVIRRISMNKSDEK